MKQGEYFFVLTGEPETHIEIERRVGHIMKSAIICQSKNFSDVLIGCGKASAYRNHAVTLWRLSRLLIILLVICSSVFAQNPCVASPSGKPSCLYDVNSADSLSNRMPLILIHGINLGGVPAPPLDVIWQKFLVYYNNNSSLKSKYKPYLFAYWSNDISVFDLGGKLRDVLDVKNASDSNFGNKPIVIVAHSMGGLVARSFMLQHWQTQGAFAGKRGGERVLKLITLGTPHHGTPMANGDARDKKAGTRWGTTLMLFDNSYYNSLVGPKFYQLNRFNLHWDNFDELLDYRTYPSERNDWLALELNSDHTFDKKIIAYAGGVIPSTSTCQFSDRDKLALCAGNAILGGALSLSNDGIVPVKSALFYDSSGSPSVLWRFFQGYNHTQIHDGNGIDNELFDTLKQDLEAIQVATPPPPMIISPGIVFAPGTSIPTIIPTFQWRPVSGADGYGLYISQKNPDGTWSLRFDSERSYGLIRNSSFTLPSGWLSDGGEYRWNMRSHNSAGWGASYSDRLYFQVNTNTPRQITVSSNPAGRLFSIEDGSTFSTPCTFSWITGSKHTIVWGTPQTGGPGVEYAFSAWADGSTQNPRTFTIPSSNMTYTANFTTLFNNPPTIMTGSASAITSTTATLSGNVNPNGSNTIIYFEYDVSSDLSTSKTTTQQNVGSGATSVSVNMNLTGLNPNTIYYYRLVGFSNAGVNRGAIVPLMTRPQSTLVNITIDPAIINFGIVPVGNSTVQAIIITNQPSSTGTLIGNVGSSAGPFFVEPGIGDRSFNLLPGQSKVVAIRFTPSSSGSFSSTLPITHNAQGSPNNISLSGIGQVLTIGIQVSPSPLVFENVSLGSPVTKIITVTNPANSTGVLNGSVSAIPNLFDIVTGTPFALPPGVSFPIRVRFWPTSQGEFAGAITITHNAANSPTNVPLIGKTAITRLSVSPGSVNFGNLRIGQFLDQTITITNDPASTANVIGERTLTLDPGSDTAFSVVSGDLTFNLSPGQSTQFVIRFSPVFSGSFSGILVVKHNSSSILIPVRFSGTADTSPTKFGISGRVVDTNSNGNSGVTITLSGSQTGTAQTDSNGNYMFENLPAGGSYTVTPSKANYVFVPLNQTFNNLSGNQTANFTQRPVNIQTIIQTNPPGRSFTVDGTTYTTSQTFAWLPGSSHTIATTSQQSGGAGTQYLWSSWNDGGALSHSVSPTSDMTFVANFTTQYYLTMNAGAGGTVSPSSGWHNNSQSVQVTATPSNGYSFSSWTGSGNGSYTGLNRQATVVVNGPITETANFTLNDFSISVTPQTRTIKAGDSTTYTVSTTNTSGNTQTMSLKVSGLPPGATALFNPASVTSGNSSTLTVSANASTPTGRYSLTITGEAAVTRSTTVELVVNRLIACVSAASYSASEMAGESIVSSFGSSLATTTLSATTVTLPTSLAGTTVRVRDSAGSERLSPLFFVSPTQINFQIPPGTVAGTAVVTITSGDGAVSMGSAQIASMAPGLFAANANGQGVAAAVALRVKANGAQSFEPIARYDTGQSKFVAVPIDLRPDTDQVFLILFGTGIRFRSSLSAIIVRMGGADAQATYAGPQGGFVGLDQINLRLPRSLMGRGEVDINLTVGGRVANTVKVSIK